jgi:hypothetical protein
MKVEGGHTSDILRSKNDVCTNAIQVGEYERTAGTELGSDTASSAEGSEDRGTFELNYMWGAAPYNRNSAEQERQEGRRARGCDTGPAR